MRFATFGEPVVEIKTDFQVYAHSKCQLLYIDTADCWTFYNKWYHDYNSNMVILYDQLLTKELAADFQLL